MADRLRREADPPSGMLASPVPQYWREDIQDYEKVQGAHGATRTILYGPNGQPIGVQDDALKVALTGRVVTFADLTPGQELAPSESYTTPPIDVSGIGNGHLIVSVQKAVSTNRRTRIDIFWNIPFESGSASSRRTPPITLDEKTQVYGYALLVPEVVSHSLQIVVTNTDASNTYAINRVTVRGLV